MMIHDGDSNGGFDEYSSHLLSVQLLHRKRSCSEWASMSEQCLLSMTSNVIQKHAELYKAMWQPLNSGSLPCLCEVT